MSGLLVQRNVVRIEVIVSMVIHHRTIKSLKYHAEKTRKTTGIEIQSQHWGGNGQLSMEGIAVEYLKSN